MESYLNELKRIEQACERNYDNSDKLPETQLDEEYIQIREAALNLLVAGKKDLVSNSYLVLEGKIIQFLRENMGCTLDMDILDKYTPSILSVEQEKFILKNSALARWS